MYVRPGEETMQNTLFKKHIISIPELNREELELIVQTAGRLKSDPMPTLLQNKVIASCFFEPSTRTRLSFETAIQRIGGSVIGFDNAGNTSLAKKGEHWPTQYRLSQPILMPLLCAIHKKALRDLRLSFLMVCQ